MGLDPTCHLSVNQKSNSFASFVWGKKKQQILLKVVFLVSIPLSRNLLSFYVNLECLVTYERGKKTQFLTLVLALEELIQTDFDSLHMADWPSPACLEFLCLF